MKLDSVDHWGLVEDSERLNMQPGSVDRRDQGKWRSMFHMIMIFLVSSPVVDRSTSTLTRLLSELSLILLILFNFHKFNTTDSE